MYKKKSCSNIVKVAKIAKSSSSWMTDRTLLDYLLNYIGNIQIKRSCDPIQ